MTCNTTILLLLLTSSSYGIASSPQQLSRNQDWRLKTRCYVPYLFPFNTNLCPVPRRRNVVKSQRNEEIDLKKFSPFRSRQLTADDEDEDDESEMTKNTRFESPLLSFRIIGCGMVTILVGVTIIIYVTSNMFYNDSIAQICSEMCLLSAYTGILLTSTDGLRLEPELCKGVAVFLQFAFLSYFLFTLIEVISMARLLFESFPKWLFPSVKSILLIGWGLPGAITIISAAVLLGQYTTRNNCWLNLNKDGLWSTVIPVGIFCGIQLLILLPILTVSEVSYGLSQYDYDRARCFLTTRWAALIVMIAGVTAWSTGLIATHSNKESFYAAFTVSSIFLGAVIIILRISTDPVIRKAVTSNVLCYFAKPSRSNKVSGWSDKVLKAREVLPRDKKIPTTDHRMSGHKGSHQTVIHR